MLPLHRVLTFTFLFSSLVFGGKFTIQFDRCESIDSTSTAVCNLATQKVHVPFIVDRTDTTVDAIETEDDAMPIGTGKDGEFSSTTYTSIDVNAGATANLITLDTDRVYEFTQFTLASGYTLKGRGSAPLKIRVQGNASIAGVIDLKGAAGSNASSDSSATPSGGASSCGGGAGGNGGSATLAAENGTSADTGNTGRGGKGLPSSNATKRSGSGGGGGFEAVPFAASAGVTEVGGGAGGSAGGAYSDEFLSTLVGGSGGGGGAAYTLGGSNGSGGGGGGGGGALQFIVGGNLRIETSGQVLATGGNGGSITGGVLAGGGGGGAGGAIVLFAGGTFIDNGVINADNGTGGGISDGAGASGRTRFVNQLTSWTGTGTESPLPNMPGSVSNSFGQTFYTKNSVLVQSTTFDTGNTAPTYTSVDIVDTKPSGSTLAYTFAGSSDNFQTDTTSYVSHDKIGELSGKRYLRYKITLTSGVRTVTPEVTSLVVHFTEHVQDKFIFGSSTGCASVHSARSGMGGPISFLLVLFSLFSIPKISRWFA